MHAHAICLIQLQNALRFPQASILKSQLLLEGPFGCLVSLFCKHNKLWTRVHHPNFPDIHS